MHKIKINNYTTEELESILHSNPDYELGIRLMACIQVSRGMSSRQLQKFYYKSHSRYCEWVKRLNQEGIEGLKVKPRSGRPPQLTQSDVEAIKDVLLNKIPEDFGYNSATWTGPMIIDYISKHYKVKYKKANIYVLMKEKMGLSYQKGRGFYPEADETKRKEFRDTIKKNSSKKIKTQ